MWEVVFYHTWVCGLLVEVKGMTLVIGNYGIRVRNGRYLVCTCVCTHQFVYPSCWCVGYVGVKLSSPDAEPDM